MNMSGSILEKELTDRLQNFRHTAPDTSESTIVFDKDYKGFDGHFENNPVVPGVCLFQWVRVHIQEHLQREVTLTNIDQCRFRKPLLQDSEGLCRVKISAVDEEKFSIQADILSQNEIACRIKAATPLTVSR